MKICIDAGHYGKYNQSPVNKAYWESDFSWKFHLLLKAELEKYGVMVITTRTNQATDLALTSRGKKAAGCDLFLSIHSNACGIESVDKPMACVCVSGKADALGQKLADMVARVMVTTDRGEIWKRKGTGGTDYYGVLRGAALVGVPGILLEHSFHTNTRATNWLLNDDNLKKMAVEEAKTIAEYYGLTKNHSTQSNAPATNPTTTPTGSFLVKVICDELNVRKGAGTENPIAMKIRKNEVYTIVDTAKSKDGGTWGKLKSGAGWINIGSKYVKRI